MKHTHKHPCNRLAKLLALALQLFTIHYSLFTAHAAVPVAWTNSPGMPPYPIKPVPHGVPVDFRVTLRGYAEPLVAPGADVRLWYQTNGMGSAWWSAPATFDGSTITASFGPAQDCGADRVSLFFGAPSNVFASAVLRLTHAPGFTPSSLPLPVPTLDFAAVELRNLSALTNGWSFGSTIGNYEVVSNAAMSAAPAVVIKNYDYWEYLDPNVGEEARLLLMPVGGWGNERFHLHYVKMAAEESYYLYFLTLPDGTEIDSVTTNTRPQSITIGGMTFTHYEGTETNKVLYSDATNGIPSAVSNIVTKSYVEDLGITSEESDPVWSADKPNYATKRDLGTVTNDLEALRTESVLVYRLYSGSNVVAEVTNFNSAAHAPELRIMQLNESNEYVTVWAETNGLARTLMAANDHADAAANAVRAQCEAAYAPRAWGRTTSGLGSDAPSNTTWISTGKLVIASGQEFVNVESSGLWVLCANGQFDFSSGTDAFFSISDRSGNKVFSVERTGDAPLPVYCSDITVRNEGGSKVITVPVPVVDATEKRNEPPYLNIATDLDGTWYSETNGIPSSIASSCEWTGQNGAWTNTVVVPASYGRMFLTYHKWQPGGTVIRNNAATDVSAGIWVNGAKFVPSVSGNNLIWTKQ